MNGKIKKIMVLSVSLTMIMTSPFSSVEVKEAKADESVMKGSLADKVTGTWSYWDGSKEVVKSNEMLLGKLPTLENKGYTRWTTDNYDKNNNAFHTSGWSTSMMWTYLNPSENGNGNAFGNSTYAIPLSYKASARGMFTTKPSTIRIDRCLLMNQPEDGSLTDFILGGDNYSEADVDKVSEWSTDVIFKKAAGKADSMKMTMTQGSPFAFVQMIGTNTATILRERKLPSDIVYYNGTSVKDSTMLVLRVFDNQDDSVTYSNYDYYAIYAAEGTSWEQVGTDADNKIGTQLKATFASEDKAYYTFAWLCESKGTNDALAKQIAEQYKDYAYNFITDTKTTFDYDSDTSTLTTKYIYTLDKKEESTKDGTIMGVIPHQYKNMSGYEFLSNEARTIRGQMKYLEGSSYETRLKYSGILPAMPSVYDSEKSGMKAYVADFMEEFGPTDTAVTKEKYSVNTYDTGKKMNRAIQVMEAAEECGDTDNAEKLLEGLKAELSDWFTYSGGDDEKYFVYNEDVGSLFGFPQSYYTVDGLTDHHFHYGYFIQAAAQVALRDSSFAKEYGNVVEELIADIATYTKNSSDAKYPFLRPFDTWEGHSWASGHANFADGNNQESSSESINAWAGLILYGQATHNKELTELGIYLYQTEISAVNNYWFDIDGDVLDPEFKQKSNADSTLPKYIQASMVWGGKMDYAAWWTAEPLQIQGINILPMTAASFYYAANPEYIINNWKTANLNEAEFDGDDKNVKRWNEIWTQYLAIADPEAAMEYFDPDCDPEAGESKAHAFHYTMALDKAGMPDLSVTSNHPLSSAFKDKDGNMTYVVYNTEEQEKVVTFSDGTQVVAQPGKMTTVTDAQATGKVEYTIEHYLQNSDGTYALFQKETKSGKVGSEVQANVKTYAGFVVNENAQDSVMSGTVLEDGSLVLKVYYDEYKERPTTLEENNSNYTKLGTVDGLDLYYYILQNDFGMNIKLLDSGTTFYMEYNGTYTPANTQMWLNKEEHADYVHGGVSKFNPNILPKNAYSTVKLKSGSKGVYVVIRYGNPTQSPDLSDYEGELTTSDMTIPTDIEELVLGTSADNSVNVAFKDSDEQKARGQKYNIYIDDVLRLSGVDAGNYTINKVTGGKVTVKVTATLGKYETNGVSQKIKISGEIYDNPIETSTKEVITTEKIVESTSADSSTTTSGEKITTNKPTTAVQSTTKDKVTTKAPTTKINIKRAKIKKIRRISKRSAKIYIKKIKKISGYQIKYSTRKSFKKKYAKVKTTKKTKYVIKKLKANKKYYVKVRAYKKVGKKTYYGRWSKKKKIKIKK